MPGSLVGDRRLLTKLGGTRLSVIAGIAVAVFVAAYVLIATEKINRVTVAVGGAAIMLALGATNAEHAFFSEESGIDWNVIFLLLGMMLIVGVLKRTGLFEYVAIWDSAAEFWLGGEGVVEALEMADSGWW